MNKTQQKLSLMWFVLVSASTLAKNWVTHRTLWPANGEWIIPLIAVASLIIGGFMGRKRA